MPNGHTEFLAHLDGIMAANDGIVGTDIGARRIFAMMTGNRKTGFRAFDDFQPRREIFAFTGKLSTMMTDDTGHFATTATDTGFRLCDNKFVHNVFLLRTGPAAPKRVFSPASNNDGDTITIPL
jgi:hypothetical protein